jgi:activator of HSP90 ATPase
MIRGMTRAIQQSVVFKAAPRTLYEMYMDSKKHSAATGGAASISRKPGGRFTAWNKMLCGRTLLLVPDRMIVQSWRSVMFKPADPDSILVITFSKVAAGTRVDLVHVNVPVQDHRGVTKGWPMYYWKPWKRYLAGPAARRGD